MAKKSSRIPSTPALRLLRKAKVPHEVVTYDYVERGGARASSAALGLQLHRVVKTLVFEDAAAKPFVVLMHGDLEVSTKQLARQIGAKSVRPCAPDVAQRHSGYRVGGTSPFGTRKRMPVYVERTILELPQITINAGARGVLMHIEPAVLTEVLQAVPVQVGLG